MEHFTKRTMEAKLWCRKCFAFTMHRVDQGRKGPCLDCIEKGTRLAKSGHTPWCRDMQQRGYGCVCAGGDQEPKQLGFRFDE